MLILVRHGKTFEPHQQAVWIGSEANPDLTAEGRRQAQALGRCLRPWAPCVVRVQASPMVRTQEHARWVLESMNARLHSPVAQVAALQELDYGTWAGRSRSDIVAEGHEQALLAWERDGEYPKAGRFAPPQQHKQHELRGWLDDLAAKHVVGTLTLAATHGGVLRLLGTMVQVPPSMPLKIACGHVAVLQLEAGNWQVRAWNVAPDDALAKILAAHGPRS